MLELNQCYNMDCMKGMAQFPDGFFDLAVVDPPYFSGPERRGYYGSKVSKIGVYRDYPVSPVWEIPGRAYFDELRRVAKHYIVWGCNYFSYEFAPGRIVWDKCKKGTSFSDCELAATDLFNTVRLFRFMWNGMLQGKSVAEGHIMQGNKKLNEQRIHPTQKPVALYDWIFQHRHGPEPAAEKARATGDDTMWFDLRAFGQLLLRRAGVPGAGHTLGEREQQNCRLRGRGGFYRV